MKLLYEQWSRHAVPFSNTGEHAVPQLHTQFLQKSQSWTIVVIGPGFASCIGPTWTNVVRLFSLCCGQSAFFSFLFSFFHLFNLFIYFPSQMAATSPATRPGGVLTWHQVS